MDSGTSVACLHGSPVAESFAARERRVYAERSGGVAAPRPGPPSGAEAEGGGGPKGRLWPAFRGLLSWSGLVCFQFALAFLMLLLLVVLRACGRACARVSRVRARLRVRWITCNCAA